MRRSPLPSARLRAVAAVLALALFGATMTTSPAGASVPGQPFTQTQCETYSDSVARLYTAALDREPEQGGFDWWLEEYTQGRWTLPRMAQFFVESPEFQEKYGALDDVAYISQIYRNVLDREPDGEGLDFWAGQMAGGMTRAILLLRFSESPENIAKSGTTQPALGEFNEGRAPGAWVCGPDLAHRLFVASDVSVTAVDLDGFHLTEASEQPCSVLFGWPERSWVRGMVDEGEGAAMETVLAVAHPFATAHGASEHINHISTVARSNGCFPSLFPDSIGPDVDGLADEVIMLRWPGADLDRSTVLFMRVGRIAVTLFVRQPMATSTDPMIDLATLIVGRLEGLAPE
ncbi:MAG: DUF4214 domain-containing protein [Acidimicrobiales bacterium]